MGNRNKSNEVVDIVVDQSGGGKMSFQLADGSRVGGSLYPSEAEILRAKFALTELRNGGARVYRHEGGGTQGFWVRGHPSLNFIQSPSGLLDLFNEKK